MARAIQTFPKNVSRRATRLVTRVATVRIVQYHHFTSSRRVSSRTDARVVDANQGDVHRTDIEDGAKTQSGVTARQDSEARDVKDDRDSDEPIALREDAEECDEAPVPLASTR